VSYFFFFFAVEAFFLAMLSPPLFQGLERRGPGRFPHIENSKCFTVFSAFPLKGLARDPLLHPNREP
jgi:hypothetical protein